MLNRILHSPRRIPILKLAPPPLSSILKLPNRFIAPRSTDANQLFQVDRYRSLTLRIVHRAESGILDPRLAEHWRGNGFRLMGRRKDPWGRQNLLCRHNRNRWIRKFILGRSMLAPTRLAGCRTWAKSGYSANLRPKRNPAPSILLWVHVEPAGRGAEQLCPRHRRDAWIDTNRNKNCCLRRHIRRRSASQHNRHLHWHELRPTHRVHSTVQRRRSLAVVVSPLRRRHERGYRGHRCRY
jgi:hypothetical protein